MKQITDCQGTPLPLFACGTVRYCAAVDGAKPDNSVYLLKVFVKTPVPSPVAGQFYLLRAKKSGVLLGRPISVYAAEESADGVTLEFLILKKGTGTAELCSLRVDDGIELIGPLGNCFPAPKKGDRVCIVGGGIGVAPVAGFATTLSEKSYDFYASFKSGSYGLEHIAPATLTVTTDDGSVGVHGMLPAALTADTLRAKGYTVVYACGPTPMLAYLQKICKEAGIQSYLSMENRMACGVGACLGCTISTSEGNKRCCKDGPVFDGAILQFDPPKYKPLHGEGGEPDLGVDVAGVHFANPVIAASGTFVYGSEYASVFDVNKLGGICSKGLTLQPRPGNTGTRLVETPSGLINSIGLENPGIAHFIQHELPAMLADGLKGLNGRECAEALRTRQLAYAHLVYLRAIEDQIGRVGSRGGAIVIDSDGEAIASCLDGEWRMAPEKHEARNEVAICAADPLGKVIIRHEPCRPIPTEVGWFEKVWAEFENT